MIAEDEVPTTDEMDEYTEQEWADYMETVYEGILKWRAEGWRHDQDGFFAEYAGSEKCLELGHVAPADPDDWETVPGHSLGWDREALCDATRYGVACLYCEGECSHEQPASVWALPGVSAEANHART